MDFGANKIPVEVMKEDAFGVLVLKIFVLDVMRSGTKNPRKSLIS